MADLNININKNSIRPADSENNIISNYTLEIREFFIDPKTGGLKDSLAVKLDVCPVCHGKNFQKYLEKNGFVLWKCEQCDFLFVNPRPKAQAMMEFFNHSSSMNRYSEMVENTKDSRQTLVFDSLAEKINNLKPNGGKLLEVGCGPGLLLETLRKKNSNWRLMGVETNARAVEICRNKQLDVLHGSLEGYIEDNFDVVVFWAVWDHFSDIERNILTTYKILKPGGVVLIGNMNFDGFDSLIMGKENPAFSLPERMNFFNIKSFRTLLDQVGFKSVDIKTTGKLDVGIVRDYWERNGRFGCNAFLEKIIFGSEKLRKDFQQFLIDHQLSGHMTIVANK